MTIDLRKQHPQVQPNMVRVPDARVREDAHQPMNRSRRARQQGGERVMFTVVAGVAAIIVIILLGYGITSAWGYFFGGTDAEVRALVANVGEHILLPENETPTLATVSDMHALEGQLFFKNAEVGDQVLMYLVSQKAIIYRPSIDKIIEVGPITGDQNI